MADTERVTRVKNRTANPIQITAEQLLREASERSDSGSNAPRQRVENFEELSEYRGRKRQEFEERIRRTRADLREWTKYAQFEASQGEFARARSVFERALDVEPTSTKLWLAYCDMELKARNINHARNLFDRAVTLLPRIDQVWYKYVYLEELLGNIAGARQVFERWMAWEPDEKAWSAYIKLELRYGEQDRASGLWERLVACHPEPKLWVKWARYEEDRQRVDRAREIYQMALEYFGEEEEQLEKAQNLYASFAKMETRHKEYERARVVYKYALDRLPRSKSSGLYGAYTAFEKQFGDRSGIESTVLGKRRIQYEDELAHEPTNYDTWFEYARLEEDAYNSSVNEGTISSGSINKVRELYERALAQVPPSTEKRHWRRYIYLFINYALFEEIYTKDYSRARDIYKAAIRLIPNKQFTFAKIWTMYARFELRRMDTAAARKVLGAAIGMCPKEKLFKDYIELELELREFDRCRTLYQKYLEFDPNNATTWIRFSELERMLGDFERARGIFEMAVEQESMDMPELLWKAYIDFEFEESEWERTRQLYERLLTKTSHVKVWVSYGQFENNVGRSIAGELQEEGGTAEDVHAAIKEGLAFARLVFERGYKDLKSRNLKEERVILLEAWKAIESEQGADSQLSRVESMMPRVVKKRRKVAEDGSMEEYFDLIFQDDESEKNPASFKLLQMARALFDFQSNKAESPDAWKQKQLQAQEQAQTSNGEVVADAETNMA